MYGRKYESLEPMGTEEWSYTKKVGFNVRTESSGLLKTKEAVSHNVSLHEFGKIDSCNNYQQRQLTISVDSPTPSRKSRPHCQQTQNFR
jgi:hypothetical protein